MSNIIKVYKTKYLLSKWYACVPTSNTDSPIQEILRGIFPGEIDEVCYDVSKNRSLLVLMKGGEGSGFTDDPPIKVRTAVDLVEYMFTEHRFQHIEHQLWICLHTNQAELLYMVAGVVREVHYEQFSTIQELNRKIDDFIHEFGLISKTTFLPMSREVFLSNHFFPNAEKLTNDDVYTALRKTHWRTFVPSASKHRIKFSFIALFLGFLAIFNLLLFSQFIEHFIPAEKVSVLEQNSPGGDMTQQIETGLEYVKTQLALITRNTNENVFSTLNIAKFFPEDLQVTTFQIQKDSIQMNVVSDDVLAFTALLRTIDGVQTVRLDPIRRNSAGKETSNITITFKIGGVK